MRPCHTWSGKSQNGESGAGGRKYHQNMVEMQPAKANPTSTSAQETFIGTH
jgi:hypothetical protein